MARSTITFLVALSVGEGRKAETVSKHAPRRADAAAALDRLYFSKLKASRGHSRSLRSAVNLRTKSSPQSDCAPFLKQ